MRDIAGNEIREGDILKVYHFTGARNKKHYMYKQVGSVVVLGNYKYLRIFHLPMTDKKESYFVSMDLDILDKSLVVSEGKFDPNRADLKGKRGF